MRFCNPSPNGKRLKSAVLYGLENKDKIMVSNRWVRTTGTLNSHPIHIQYREDWQQAKDARQYGICVQIAWHAEGVDDTGFPPLGAQLDILALGEQLQALEANNNCVLTMIIAHEAITQWVIYVKDLEQFNQELASIPEPEAGFPIEMVANTDADWSHFSKVYDVIEEIA